MISNPLNAFILSKAWAIHNLKISLTMLDGCDEIESLRTHRELVKAELEEVLKLNDDKDFPRKRVEIIDRIYHEGYSNDYTK